MELMQAQPTYIEWAVKEVERLVLGAAGQMSTTCRSEGGDTAHPTTGTPRNDGIHEPPHHTQGHPYYSRGHEGQESQHEHPELINTLKDMKDKIKGLDEKMEA